MSSFGLNKWIRYGAVSYSLSPHSCINSMNNLLSYCGLTDSRMRASEKDLPVLLVDMKTGSNGSAQEVFERRKAIENPRQKSSKYLLRVEEV